MNAGTFAQGKWRSCGGSGRTIGRAFRPVPLTRIRTSPSTSTTTIHLLKTSASQEHMSLGVVVNRSYSILTSVYGDRVHFSPVSDVTARTNSLESFLQPQSSSSSSSSLKCSCPRFFWTPVGHEDCLHRRRWSRWPDFGQDLPQNTTIRSDCLREEGPHWRYLGHRSKVHGWIHQSIHADEPVEVHRQLLRLGLELRRLR